jgi:hypothetical protein
MISRDLGNFGLFFGVWEILRNFEEFWEIFRDFEGF